MSQLPLKFDESEVLLPTENLAFDHPEESQDSQISEKTSEIAIPILCIHCLGLAALIPYFWSWTNLGALVLTTLLFGQGINLGYHRILTHKSLTVPKWLERFYVLLALCSLEESPGKWVSTHRRHHKHSDLPEDPHSPTESFFWSHMGWLLKSRNGKQEFAHDDRYAADVMKDPVYRLLESNPLLPGLLYLLHAGAIFVVALVVGFSMQNPEHYRFALGMLFWAVLLRTVVVWHITWSVNSLAHRYGYQNYETSEGSRNNWFVALLSSGEGWHNNHHHDQASASNQHRWWELDLTYLHIRMLEICGLAKNVVRPRHQRQTEIKFNTKSSDRS